MLNMTLQYFPLCLSKISHAAIALLLLAGCSNKSAETDKIAACRARSPVQTEGVYGCVTQSNDVGNPPPPASPYASFPVEIFQSEPPPTPDDGLTPFAQTISDTYGYYEVGLAPGTYWICTSFRRCSKLVVPTGTCVALDYDFGVGPGWSLRTPAVSDSGA